jgi:hypothetical protein
MYYKCGNYICHNLLHHKDEDYSVLEKVVYYFTTTCCHYTPRETKLLTNHHESRMFLWFQTS